MTDTMRNVRDTLEGALDDLSRKHASVIGELEEALDELDTYRELFDDEYDAQDAKDYVEEMSDIFDDVSEAQQARDLIDSLSYEGIDDFSDFLSFKETLTDEIKGELPDIDELQAELTTLRARVEELETQRAIAINTLGAVPLEQHTEVIEKITADQTEERRAAEEGAYVAGIIDSAQYGEQGIPLDINLTEENNDE